MKTILSLLQKKMNLALLAICVTAMVTSCSSDDDSTPEAEEMMQEEEVTLDFDALVDSWQAQDFIFENSNSSLPDTNVTGQGGNVDLEIMSDGSFLFTVLVFPDTPEFMNSGEFRIENNMLQARFDPNSDFQNLEASIDDQQKLILEGNGFFDFSGEGSNVPLAFRAIFFRK